VRYDSPTLDPAVEVRRSGETVALAHLSGTPDPEVGPRGTVKPTMQAPWATMRVVDYCPAFLAPPGRGDNQRSPS
jgi:hypothetical protein